MAPDPGCSALTVLGPRAPGWACSCLCQQLVHLAALAPGVHDALGRQRRLARQHQAHLQQPGVAAAAPASVPRQRIAKQWCSYVDSQTQVHTAACRAHTHTRPHAPRRTCHARASSLRHPTLFPCTHIALKLQRVKRWLVAFDHLAIAVHQELGLREPGGGEPACGVMHQGAGSWMVAARTAHTSNKAAGHTTTVQTAAHPSTEHLQCSSLAHSCNVGALLPPPPAWLPPSHSSTPRRRRGRRRWRQGS